MFKDNIILWNYEYDTFTSYLKRSAAQISENYTCIVTVDGTLFEVIIKKLHIYNLYILSDNYTNWHELVCLA